MSKMKPKAKSLAKRRKKLDQRRTVAFGTGPVQLATQAIFTEGPAKAKQILLDFKPIQELPIDALELLAEICVMDEDKFNVMRCAVELANHFPNDPIRQHSAASAAWDCGKYVTSLLHSMHYLRLTPAGDVDEQLAATIAGLRVEIGQLAVREHGPTANVDNLELVEGLAFVEQTLMLFSNECFNDALSLTQRHIAKFPKDNRGINNCAVAYYTLGEFGKAIEMLDRSLEINPSNYFAVAKRCSLRFFRGQTGLSDEDAATLASLEPSRATDLSQGAEAFAIRGEDKQVLSIFDQLHSCGWEKNSPGSTAMIYHYAATAHCRQGNQRKAKSLWKQALTFVPNLHLAHDNLQILKAKDGQRNQPYYLPLQDWITTDLYARLLELIDRIGSEKNDDFQEELKLEFKQLLTSNPELLPLIEPWLDRADENAQVVAIELAIADASPASVDLLMRFVKSRRGSDSRRYLTAIALKKRNLIAESELKIFFQDKLATVELPTFFITEESKITKERPRRALEFSHAGFMHLRNSEGDKAEKEFRKAIELDPDSPDLWNNLAMALLLQKRTPEAGVILRMIPQRWPDYYFGQIAHANDLINCRKYNEAQKELRVLSEKTELHRTELIPLCKIHITLYAAKKEREKGLGWLMLLTYYSPDDRELESYRRRLNVR